MLRLILLVLLCLICLLSREPDASAAVSCAVTITSPANGATIGSPFTLVVQDVCPAGTLFFNRLYYDGTTFDFHGNSIVLPAVPDGSYWLGVIAWDPTGLVKYGTSAGVTIQVTNGVAMVTPAPSPTITPTPAPTITPVQNPTAVQTPGGAAITITAPAANSNVNSGIVPIAATWSGPLGSTAEIIIDHAGSGIGYSNTSPVTASWNTSQLANDTAQYITAEVIGSNGAILATNTVTVDYYAVNPSVTPTPTPVAPTPTPIPTASATPVPSVTPTPNPTPLSLTYKANDFLNTMGVGTKDIQTANPKAAIIAGFKYLGIRNGRDDATHTTSGVGSVQDLCDIHAATGVMYDELPIVDTPGSNLTDTKAEWEQLAACGAMGFAEGPNEPNNFGFTNDAGQACNGSTYIGCATYMRQLYSLVHSDAKMPSGLLLLGMTEVGAEAENDGLQFLTVPSGAGSLAATGTHFADVANTHSYVQGSGSAGVSLIDNQVRLAETIAPGPWDTYGEYWGPTWSKAFAGASAGQNDRPKVTTETGWNVFAHGSTITRAQQGKLIADLWLDAAQLGWSKTFVYEMFEGPPNDEGYGFLNADEATPPDLTPTLAGVYTHNLTTILADTSSAFTTVTANPTVTGMPLTGYSQLIQKSNGTYEFVVWGEAFASAKATPITVNLGASYQRVNVYDVTVGTAPTQTLSNVSSVAITLTDHPLIVEFNIADPPATPTPAASPTPLPTVTPAPTAAFTATPTPRPSATPTPAGVYPLGVAAPAGKSWHTTFDDEFTATSINTGQWNYGYSNDHNCRASGCVEGQPCAGSDVNHQRCNDDFDFAHDFLGGAALTQIPSSNDGTGEVDTGNTALFKWGGMAGLNSAAKFIQRYGYFEARMKLPPNNAAASGQGSDFWGVPETSDSFNSTDCNGIVGARDEVDIAENSNGGAGLQGNGSQFSVQTTIYDCGHTIASGGFDYQIDMSNGQDLSAAYHTYGLNWLNDGSPEGTMCFYLDGAQKGCHTLSGASVGWANGIFLIAYDVYCYPGGILGGGACTGNETEGLQTEYIRAWQAH